MTAKLTIVDYAGCEAHTENSTQRGTRRDSDRIPEVRLYVFPRAEKERIEHEKRKRGQKE